MTDLNCVDEPGYRETHLSRLFFTPNRVYKILKPVTTSFASFAATEDRLAGMEAEYYLNSRISPDVYLGVTDLVENDQVVDRMLIMRRLPDDRQLSALLERDGSSGQIRQYVREAARTIAAFHAAQEPIRGRQAHPASSSALEANWNDNFTNLAHLTRPGTAPDGNALIDRRHFDELREMVTDYLSGRHQLFNDRQRSGRVIDGHGDLRAEHVFCLDDGARIIDCVAFRDDYRIVDVLNDVAFLAMDLHRLAGRELAGYFISAYDEFSNEHHPSTLAHFFVAYRAHIRAKVAAIRLSQGNSDAALAVQMYHQLAVEHMRAAQVRLVLVGGGAGVGKSTVAEGLAQQLRAVWLRSDEIRKAMGGMKADDHAYAQPDEGLYRPEISNKVYTALVEQAGELLERGENVVLDATWSKTRHRVEARNLASDKSAQLTELKCHTSLAIAKERIERRGAMVFNPSDATVETADYLAANFDLWPQSIEVDTSGSIAEARRQALIEVLRPVGASNAGSGESEGDDRRPEATAAAMTAGRTPVAVDGSRMFGMESITLFFSTRSSLSLTSVFEDEPNGSERPGQES